MSLVDTPGVHFDPYDVDIDADTCTTCVHLRTRRGQPMEVQQENVANGDVFAEYVEQRATHPSDDIMTRLLEAEFEDEHGDKRTLTRDEVLSCTAVIAETSRFEPTGHATARIVTHDVEYHSTTVPEGASILLLIGSANRDPRRHERPDVFDVNRARLAAHADRDPVTFA